MRRAVVVVVDDQVAGRCRVIRRRRRSRRQRRQSRRRFLAALLRLAARLAETLFHLVPSVAVQVSLAALGPLQSGRVLEQPLVAILFGRKDGFPIGLVPTIRVAIVMDLVQHVHGARVPDTGTPQFVAPQLILVPR